MKIDMGMLAHPAIGILLAQIILMAAVNGVQAQDELPPRDYHVETTLFAAGKPEAVIVSSATRPAYAAIAERVQNRIRELAGTEVPILDAAGTSTEEVLADRNAIVLGNLATSRLVEALYWEWYTLLDLWYPGPGGYVLRTLHDPYGTGKNVIFLGGSDDEGVSQAADALCQALTGADPLTIGRLMDIKLGDNHAVAGEGEWLDPRLRIFHEPLQHKTVHESPLGYTDLSLAGLRYYYNGDEEALKRFRELALTTDLLSNTYHYYAHMQPIIWDLIEESPLFTDDDRRAINQKLLAYARGNDGTAGRERLLAAAEQHNESKKLLDRHDAMQANCTLTHSRYLNKYWPADEWEQNLDAVRQYYDRLMTSAKGWRDEGNMHTYLECPLMAALLLRDRRLIDSGALRHYAELVLMFCDNRGSMTTFGGGYPSSVLRASAALLDEPGLLATLPRSEEAERAAGRFPPPYGFMNGQAWDTGLQPEPMQKMIGVYHRPLTEWQWEHYGKGIPFEQGMDKLTMRSGFGPDDQYLLLDGISVGGGKPLPNRNAILSFVQDGRMFLSGGTHSVVVSREGLGQGEGQIVALEATANLPTFGYSHTRVPDHPFSTWDRRIFWRKGKWLVVLDQVTAKEEGRHSVVCNWDTRGSLRVVGDAAEATQGEGEERSVFHIRNAEPLRTDASGSRVRQTECREMGAGDEVVATNLLYVDSGRTPQEYTISKVSSHAAALTGDEDAYVGVAPDGSFERGGVALQGAAFCLSPTSVSVVAGTSLRCGTVSIAASAPCNMELEPPTGRITIEAAEAVEITVGTQEHSLEPGTHTLAAEKQAASSLDELVGAIRQDAATPKSEPPPPVPPGLPSIPVVWSANVGDYGAYCVGDVDGDGRVETLVGMRDGRAVCLDEQGQGVWEFRTEGAVRAIAHATLAAGPAVLIGSEGEHVYAIAADGSKLLWKHKCHFSEERYQAAPWWTIGGRAPVVAIYPYDLDGDGEVEIICGTGAGFVETLTSGGEQEWLCEFFWGIPDHFGVAPMPDGSKHLLVDATASASGSWTWRLNAQGEPVNRNAFGTGRGSWDSTVVTCSTVADMDGTGAWMAIVGRGGAYNELALHDAISGERKWIHALADRVTGVAAMDLDGDGTKEVLAASVSAWLSAFDIKGELLWATQLPNEILAIGEAADGLFAQCADGNVYRLSPAGEVTGIHAPERKAPPSVGQHFRFQHGDGALLIGDRSGQLTALAVGEG